MNQRIKELISKIAPSLALDELQNELEVSDTVQPHPFTCICDKCCSPKPQEPIGYDEIFNAIAEAASPCGEGIGVSVKAFKRAIGGEIFLSPTIPEGMALVPIVPTEAMLFKLYGRFVGQLSSNEFTAYNAMIQAVRGGVTK